MQTGAARLLKAELDGIVTLTLNRPDTLNPIDAELHAILTAELTAIAARPDIRCVILAANGRAFSAGGDLNEIFTLHEDAAKRHAMVAAGRRLYAALLDCTKPIVVAMQGDAHGLGANIVLACDAVIAARNARISDAHVRVGLVAGDGGCVVWPQAMGMLMAKRHLLTGDAMTAEQAFARGLVTDLVETPADVLPAAQALAKKIAGLPPLAVQGTKRALNQILKQRAGEVFETALALETATLASADALEAARAFLEKRKPNYSGQ